MSAVFKFSTNQVLDEPKTREMGTPHYREEEILIIKADERSSVTVRPEDWFAKHREKMGRARGDELEYLEKVLEKVERAYRRFQDGKPDEIEGRPLAEWPRMSPGVILTLNSLNIFSVEDMAAASDTQCGKIHNGIRYRDEAQRFLEASAEDGPSAMATRVAELEAKLEATLADNADLRKLLDDKPKRARKAA